MSESGHPLRDHPAVVDFLADGAEVHLSGKATSATSMVARIALAAGIGCTLTFVTPNGASSGPEIPFETSIRSEAAAPPPSTGPPVPPPGIDDEPDPDAAFARILADAGLENPPAAAAGRETRTPWSEGSTITPTSVAPPEREGDRNRDARAVAAPDVPERREAAAEPEAAKPTAQLPRVMTAAVLPRMEIGREPVNHGFDSVPLRSSISDEIDFKGRKVSREVAETIFDAAQTTGANPVLMMAMADKESGFRVDARPDSSSALGLYQFLEATWLEVVKLYGAKHGLEKEASAVRLVDGNYKVDDKAQLKRILDLRGDAGISSLMACELHLAARSALRKRIGEEPSPAEAYLAHFMGTNGAGQLLEAVRSSPRANASRMFPKAAKANPSVFHEGPRRRPRNVQQVNELMLHAVQVRVDRFSDIEQKMAPAAPMGMTR